jgi:serine/threonine protein phosphatase PrpC
MLFRRGRDRWEVASAAVTGASHVKRGIACQDKTAWHRRRRVLTVALADGAGSCSRSDVGAQIAAETACQALAEKFNDLMTSTEESIAARVVGRVTAALAQRARDDDIAITDLASTLTFAAVLGGRFVVGSIGDSVIAAVGESTGAVVVEPKGGQIVGQTFFTTMANATALTEVKKGHLTGAHSFMLMSDGAAELLVEEDTNTLAAATIQIGQWLLTHEASTISAKLHDLMERKFIGATSDDCSILLATLVPGRRRWRRRRAARPGASLLQINPPSRHAPDLPPGG